MSPTDVLARLMASPNLASRRWIWEQYDHMVMRDTVARPGGDSAIVRVHGTSKGLAITTDCTPRYCEIDPIEGGKQAVAEAWRNLTAVGARPLAVTDNMNFGNPEKPEIMGQFAGCIQGMAEACRALDFPVVSGNVSLYNETDGRAILPAPVIGGVGLIDDVANAVSLAFRPDEQSIIVIGETRGHIGMSLYLLEFADAKAGVHATTFPTAGYWSRSPKWRLPGTWAPTSWCRTAIGACSTGCSVKIRGAILSRPPTPRRCCKPRPAPVFLPSKLGAAVGLR
jgi:phosphoribosylformylglycinamidine synthase